jgi:catechol-2,3-dioxygenase
MATEPLDVASLLRAAGDAAWTGMPRGTVMGHVHLHVGDLREAEAFYADALGFDVVVRGYPGHRRHQPAVDVQHQRHHRQRPDRAVPGRQRRGHRERLDRDPVDVPHGRQPALGEGVGATR